MELYADKAPSGSTIMPPHVPSNSIRKNLEGDVIKSHDKTLTTIEAPRIGERIRSSRESRGVTVEELAAQANLDADQLYRLEAGLSENLNYPFLDAIATNLGVRMLDLLLDKTPPSRLSADELRTRLSNSLPDTLRHFVEEEERAGREIDSDLLAALAEVGSSESSPSTSDEWAALVKAIRAPLYTERQ